MTSTVEFTLTPAIRQSLEFVAANRAAIPPRTLADADEVKSLPAVTADHISLTQVQLLSKLHRALAPVVANDFPHTGHIHAMLAGASLYQPPPPMKKPRDPEFLAFLARMRVKQERREIAEINKSITGKKALSFSFNDTRTDSGHSQASMASESRELGHGVNILTLMGTGFAVFYYGGTMIDQHSQLVPIMCGLAGLILAMLMEVILLLIRERRREEFEEKQKLKENQQQIIELERKVAKERQMREILEQMNNSREEHAIVGERAERNGE